MKRNKGKTSYSTEKISETFLNFAKPLLEVSGGKATKDQTEAALMIAFTVWNSLVFDKVDGNSHYVDTLRNSFSNDPPAMALFEFMITRKNALFGDDLRLIGDYKLMKKLGGWTLRAEERSTDRSRTSV